MNKEEVVGGREDEMRAMSVDLAERVGRRIALTDDEEECSDTSSHNDRKLDTDVESRLDVAVKKAGQDKGKGC